MGETGASSFSPVTLSFLVQAERFFSARGVPCYVVGGAVRDLLLVRGGQDIDLALAGDALSLGRELAAALGGSFVPLDEVHQVARVVLPQGQSYLDLSAWEGELRQDLGRRDFTIDAMAVPLAELLLGRMSLVDPFHGQEDLARKRVRAVNEKVFAEDPARLLRALRLAAELGFELEEGTEALIKAQVSLVLGVAGERVRDELWRLFALPGTANYLRQLDCLGLGAFLFPELEKTKGVEQPPEHFWDVYEHSLETVAALEGVLRMVAEPVEGRTAIPWLPELGSYFEEEVASGHQRKVLLKWAALFHDLGKPQAKARDARGRTRFLGHAEIGAAQATAIMQRLRFSSREVKMVEAMVRHHLRPSFLAALEEPSPRAVYRYFRDTEEVGIDVIYLCLADFKATRGPRLLPEEWQEQGARLGRLLERRLREEKLVHPPRLLDGHDIMERFGLSPGPSIGLLLEAVREAQAAGEVTTREETLALVAKLVARGLAKES